MGFFKVWYEKCTGQDIFSYFSVFPLQLAVAWHSCVGTWRWKKGKCHTFEGIFGFANTEVAGLLQGRKGFCNARAGLLIGLNIEVVDCVVDELDRADSKSQFAGHGTLADVG